jgi:SH3-like domain-containing protein
MFKRLLIALSAAASFGLVAPPAFAEDPEVPYWASIRAKEVNMRVGPGEDYRINWVYRRPHLPLKVLRTMEGWRLVQDPDGARGWMLARFLSRERGGYVRGKGLADMRDKGDDDARLLWRLAPGVVGKLDDCKDNWCHLEVEGHAGFVRQDRIWGAGAP